MLFLIRFWREIIIFLLGTALILTTWYYKNEVSGITEKLQKEQAISVLNELQKEALRKGILDQNDAVEKQRIDAEKRAVKLANSSKIIWSDFEKLREIVKNLSGDDECTAMRKMINEEVE